MNDSFGTARMRDTVLAAWTASPARFREDANAEEDFALGGYRDRLVVELAQNAADAALRAGAPGHLRLTLRDGVLFAANTGAPLDAEGVEGLSTLRVSGKKDETGAVGRFGVGFAAVVSVCDAPSIVSREAGGVRWSRDETAALVAARSELAAELAGREGHVPLLRLPFPAEPADVPDGFDTLVRLPLRDKAAERAVRRMLREAGPALPLAMQALAVIEIELDGETRVISADGWHSVTASGSFDAAQVAELFADRPTEERSRPYWQVRWAVPVAASGEPRPLPEDVPPVVHAPTPSDEPLDLPALLIATLPMATDRRHVASGPLTDFLVERAADAYVELMASLPRTPRLLDLVPGLIGKGELDARIRRAILRRLPDVPLLPAVSAPDEEPRDGRTGAAAPVPRTELPDGRSGWLVAGREARVVAGPAEFLDAIAEMVPGLLPAGWPARHPALAALDVRRVELADVIDMLSGDAVKDREPAWWRSLYEVLPADDPEAIGAVPVPLADGRLVRGPRGTLVLTDGSAAGAGPLDPAVLAPLGLRVVHPDAAHPLLLRLGAAEATPRTVLEDPLTHAAVTESADSADPEPVAQAVLALVEAAGLAAGEAPWLAGLALRGADGELYPAGDLLLADGALATLIDQDVPFGVAAPDLVERYGSHVLAATGVLDGFAVVNDADVLLDPEECDHDLDREDEWLETVLDLLPELDVPPVAREFTAVRDLEYVAEWPSALALLSRPPLRTALQPLRVLVSGEVVEVPSYTSWWLSTHPVLDGRRPTSLRLPGGDPLLFGLYGDAPAGVDEVALTMIGVRSSLAELLASHGGPDELLDLMADPSIEVDRAQLRALWIALAAVDPSRVRPPSAVRAVLEGEIVVADVEDGRVIDGTGDSGTENAGEPVVVEAPDLLALVADRPLVLAPFDLAEALSELLDLPLAGELVSGAVTSSGEERPVPPEVRSLLPTAPSTYVEHGELLVDGRPVPWRFYEGKVHASGVEGLARGLAWASGQWGDRLAVAALLRDPGRVPLLLAEADLDS
ncbi:sacsin N-terminal ATP-binding-like domain-containing protein [Microtetraspora malaysiensis]|uniref:sacsin N-terminal ATP-binding-like domain-containing protein n=1 Tax=Microtetraspora malaysiensis TaxID=161358 RepID=UPI003D922ADC